MLRSEVIERVKARLDEFSPFEEPESLVALPQSEVKPMDSYIEKVLQHAQDVVMKMVPLGRVQRTVVDLVSEANGHSVLGMTPVMQRMGLATSDDYEVGVMEIPGNFLRLHTVSFDTWKRDVKMAYEAEHPMYVVQRNKYTRGRNHKPVVVLNNGMFEVYSLTFAAGDGVDHCRAFKYIPMATENETTFEDSVADLIVLEAAREVAEIFGKGDVAKALGEEMGRSLYSL